MAARARQYVCPICARDVAPRDANNPSFPFCSPACKLVDLGRWLDGAYRVPVGDELSTQHAEHDAANGAGSNGGGRGPRGEGDS